MEISIGPSGDHRRSRHDPANAGAPWWTYRRPTMALGVRVAPTVGAEPGELDEPDPSNEQLGAVLDVPSGRPLAGLAFALLGATIFCTRVLGIENSGLVLVPAAGIAGAAGFGRYCLRVRPNEPWLPRLLVLGTAAKLTSSYLRWLTITDAYDGGGDTYRYDVAGRKFVQAWVHGTPAPQLDDLRQTNFLKWLTGITYYLFGQDLVAAFFVFALIAVIGSYFWYRALADVVPFANKRLFFIFMMFAPSVVFWPSSLGKEALMQLGVGAVAWATSLFLRNRFIQAVPLMAGGGWLLWIVRPHLLALVTLAAAVPYFVGRVGVSAKGSLLSRPVGMVVLALLVVFTVTAGAKYLGIQNLSLDSVKDQLDEQTARSSKGGSQFSHGSNSLSPLALPNNVVTVLFRPFLFEARSGLQLLAALESTVLMGFIVARFDGVRLAFRRARSSPFLLYCWVLLGLYATAFGAFANFGLLNRQRSLVLPALYALIAVEPALLNKRDPVDDVIETTAIVR